MKITFESETFSWRGPAPYVFAAVPEEAGANIKAMSRGLSYGWGCIPVSVTIGKTEWKTSLMPKDGKYLLPLKMAVQRSEKIKCGDRLHIVMELA